MTTGANGSALPPQGSEIPAQAFPAVTAAMLKEYAAASGDSNPIHLDETVARATGLPGIIAHGMVVAAWIAERALRFGGEAHLDMELKEFSTRFRAMVFLGDVISVGGTVKESGPEGVTLELQAKNQKGEVTTTGIARFRA
jgi:acyl dehydratase